MKKLLTAASLVIALAAITVFGMTGCQQPTSNNGPQRTTPTRDDFDITGPESNVADGTPKTVTVEPKAEKSRGAITVRYEGRDTTNYEKSETAPSEAGKYAVTFDVAADYENGFNAASGLLAGPLTIYSSVIEELEDVENPDDPDNPGNKPVYKIIDFEDGWDNSGYGERTVDWKGYAFTVSGVVGGTDTGDRYHDTKGIRLRGNAGDNCRVELASYLSGIKSVYFDYASYSSHNNGKIVLSYQEKGSSTWVPVKEIIAESWGDKMLTAKGDINKSNVRFKIAREGDLASFTSVNIDNIVITAESDSDFDKVAVDPVASDFYFTGLTATANGSPHAVTITPKPSKSQGTISNIQYEGTDGTTYSKKTTAPSDEGKYNVTFDVAADTANGFNAKTGLSAGTLVISAASGGGEQSFTIDFEDSAWASVPYTGKDVEWNSLNWRAVGYSSMDANDRRTLADGTPGSGSGNSATGRSLRLRGNTTADIDNGTNNNINRIELIDYLPNGIKSISFDYGSYSNHSKGTLIVSYMKEGGSWEEVGRITEIPAWVDYPMLNKKFEVNQTGKVRFKIEKLSATGSTTVNVDNIVVTY